MASTKALSQKQKAAWSRRLDGQSLPRLISEQKPHPDCIVAVRAIELPLKRVKEKGHGGPPLHDGDYWYIHRHELEQEQVFRTTQGSLVKLDRGVPGDDSKWYVLTWHNNGWSYDDATLETGELCGDPIEDPAEALGKGADTPGM